MLSLPAQGHKDDLTLMHDTSTLPTNPNLSSFVVNSSHASLTLARLEASCYSNCLGNLKYHTLGANGQKWRHPERGTCGIMEAKAK